MTRSTKTKLIAFAGIALIIPTAASANWRTSHPRRAEVNARARNIDRQIASERREGELTGAQAAQLRRDDNGIRREEHQMAVLDHGHITKADQRALNQQETELRNKIPN
ncbi:MAG: hypothetical protein ACRCSO_10395 [Sphingomonas sp.]